MTPYYDEDGIVIYHGDCREVLPDVGHVGAVVTDPPYGISWSPRVNHRDSPWKDTERVGLSTWVGLSPKACIWGGNYYTDQLPMSESWLIWLKRPQGFDDDPRTYSGVEMAWTNFGGKPRTKMLVWDGGKRQGNVVNRTFCHPAQKPLELMRWSIVRAGEIDGPILDPFMGSGTTLQAAKAMGHQAIGIELEEKYCEIAANRLRQGALTDLFA